MKFVFLPLLRPPTNQHHAVPAPNPSENPAHVLEREPGPTQNSQSPHSTSWIFSTAPPAPSGTPPAPTPPAPPAFT